MSIEKKDPNTPDLSSLIVDPKPGSSFSLDITSKVTLVSMAVGVVLLFLIQEAAKKTFSICKNLRDRFVSPLEQSKQKGLDSTEEIANKVREVKQRQMPKIEERASFDRKAFIAHQVKNVCDSLVQSTHECFSDPIQQKEKIAKIAGKLEKKIRDIFSKEGYSSRFITVDQVNGAKSFQANMALNNYLKAFQEALSFKASFEESEAVADYSFTGRLDFDKDDKEDWFLLQGIAAFLIKRQNPSTSTVKTKAESLCLEQLAMEVPISPKECVAIIESKKSVVIKQPDQFKDVLSPKGVDERSQ